MIPSMAPASLQPRRHRFARFSFSELDDLSSVCSGFTIDDAVRDTSGQDLLDDHGLLLRRVRRDGRSSQRARRRCASRACALEAWIWRTAALLRCTMQGASARGRRLPQGSVARGAEDQQRRRRPLRWLRKTATTRTTTRPSLRGATMRALQDGSSSSSVRPRSRRLPSASQLRRRHALDGARSVKRRSPPPPRAWNDKRSNRARIRAPDPRAGWRGLRRTLQGRRPDRAAAGSFSRRGDALRGVGEHAAQAREASCSDSRDEAPQRIRAMPARTRPDGVEESVPVRGRR